jgi:hypothetical protein
MGNTCTTSSPITRSLKKKKTTHCNWPGLSKITFHSHSASPLSSIRLSDINSSIIFYAQPLEENYSSLQIQNSRFKKLEFELNQCTHTKLSKLQALIPKMYSEVID